MSSLKSEIQSFTTDTVRGSLRGMVRMVSSDMVRGAAAFTVPNYLIEYMNTAYSSLVRYYGNRDGEIDIYYINRFGRMSELEGHSFICLLNLTMAYMLDFFKRIFPLVLLDSGVSEFERSFDSIAPTVHSEIPFADHSSGRCTGINIAECDPEEKLFFTLTEEEARHSMT